MPTSRVWFITGCSGGFGRAVAQAALARGDSVIGTLRKPEQCSDFERLAPGRAFAEQLDVRDPVRLEVAVAAAVERCGCIDVLFSNAGHGMLGAIEETSLDEAREIFETNFFGTFNAIRAILPQLRRQGSGHVLNMSSGAGIGAVPGLGLYSATKFAVEGLSEALAAEVAQFGIHVTVVEPGAFRTGFATGAAVPVARPLETYAALTAHVAAGMRHWYGAQAGDPREAAAAILRVVDAPQPPLRLVLGADAVAGVRAKIESLRTAAGPESRNVEIVRDFIRACDGRSLERLLGFFTDDCVYHNIPMAPVHGPAGVREVLMAFQQASTEWLWDVHAIAEAADGTVLTERTDRIAAGGQWFDFPTMGAFELRDGKISAWRDYFDLAQAMDAMAKASGAAAK